MNFDNISHLWASVIVDQCIKNGVVHFYCCPGMRNAPLLRAINEHPKATAYLGHDERSQSYRALGHAKSSASACALVCTSGTAVANFLPAVIEASKTQIPLIILSADRPGELNAVDANQTINQIEVLRDYTKAFCHLSEPQSSYPLNVLAGQLSHLLYQANLAPAGPIHLNIPLREPLDQTQKPLPNDMALKAKELIHHEQAKLTINKPVSSLAQGDLDDMIMHLKNAKKPVIIFGPLSRQFQHETLHVLEGFLKHYHGHFYCDVETGGKFYFGTDQGLIPSLDHPEVLEQLTDYAPDLIMHFGHRLTSKHYYRFLNHYKQKNSKFLNLQVVQTPHHQDQGYSFSFRYDLDPLAVIKKLTNVLEQDHFICDYSDNMIAWNKLISKKETVIESGPLSYAYLSKKAIECCTKPSQFFIGNSTFIRSFDSYARVSGLARHINVYANRGASGIEGHMATALGLLEGMNKLMPTVVYLGDISFIHDASTLYLITELAKNNDLPLLVVIANNHGGGIFKLLPIRDDKKTLPLITTPHSLQFSAILQALGLKSEQVTTKTDYQKALTGWYQRPSLKFIEVMIDDDENTQVYEQLKTVKL